MEVAEKLETTEGYVNLFGSALAIAFLSKDEDKVLSRKARAQKSHQYIRSMLKPLLDLDDDLIGGDGSIIDIDGVDNDADHAFELVIAEFDARLKEIESKRAEIFLLGQIAGTEPATDLTFSAHGLKRPSSQSLKEFFWEGD